MLHLPKTGSRVFFSLWRLVRPSQDGERAWPLAKMLLGAKHGGRPPFVSAILSVNIPVSVIILELAAIQVARWSKIVDLFFSHLFSSRLERCAIQLTNFFESLFVSLLLRIFGVGSAKRSQQRRFYAYRDLGTRRGYTCMTKNWYADSCTDAQKRSYDGRDGLGVNFICDLAPAL